MRGFWGGLFLIFALSACGPTADIIHDSELRSGGIIGGKAVSGLSGFSHFMVQVIETKKYSTSKCSGIVIGKRAILTAAHCAVGSLDNPQALSVRFDLSLFGQPDTLLGVQQIQVHKGYIPEQIQAGNDLAVLTLASDAPPQMRNANLGIDATSSTTGELDSNLLRIAGFGRSSENSESNLKTLRQANIANAVLDPNAPLWYFSQTSVGICSGDSGGALTVIKNGKISVIGISSFVFNAKNPEHPCKGTAAYTNLLAYADWLSPFLD